MPRSFVIGNSSMVRSVTAILGRRGRSLVALGSLVIASPLAAQGQGQEHGAMAGMHHDAAPAAVSPRAQKQIDSVVRAIVPLGATGAARAAGFYPVLGWIPTMGTHWVDRALMVKDRQTDRTAPSQLMFSRIAGKDSLVGAAYGYFTPAADRDAPALFDGAPAWHEHPDLAPPGQTLKMLHVWFVPSPDGPFAGTNPNLPFWALGLAAPDSTRMHDPAFSLRVRKASLALAEIADTTSIFPNLERRPEVHAVLMARRDSIRALVPELLAAQRVNDSARWDRAAAGAATQWEAIYASYYASARTQGGKQRIAQYVSLLLGQGHEH
jgi:hypothetical protein